MIFINETLNHTDKVTLSMCCVMWVIDKFFKTTQIRSITKIEFPYWKMGDNNFFIGFGDEDTVKPLTKDTYFLTVLDYVKSKGKVTEDEYKVLRVLGRYLSTDEITDDVGRHCCGEGNDELVECVNMAGLSFIYKSILYGRDYKFGIDLLMTLFPILDRIFRYKLSLIAK